MVRAVTSSRLDTAVAANRLLRAELGVVVSEEAVRRALRMEGLEAALKEMKPKLPPQDVKKRLEFAIAHRDWTVADYKRVLWFDETKIDRFCSDGLSWCWVRVSN